MPALCDDVAPCEEAVTDYFCAKHLLSIRSLIPFFLKEQDKRTKSFDLNTKST